MVNELNVRIYLLNICNNQLLKRDIDLVQKVK